MTEHAETAVGGRELLRHAVATVAYRGAKAFRGAPEDFARFRAGETTRTPAEILAHICDVLDWGLSLAKGAQAWHKSEPQPWNDGVRRFFKCLHDLDERLASPEPLGCPVEKLFQAPVADALTHIGQISMLRRLAGSPVRGENYLGADIAIGRVGIDQAAPKFEFD